MYENKLYKKVVGILREELELYIKTFYLLNQDILTKESLLKQFFKYNQLSNSKGVILRDREILNFVTEINGYGWEELTYKYGCYFIHLTVFHNWSDEDVTEIIKPHEKKMLIEYINQFHSANLTINSTFEDIIKYSLVVFEKIKTNMECSLKKLEEDIYN